MANFLCRGEESAQNRAQTHGLARIEKSLSRRSGALGTNEEKMSISLIPPRRVYKMIRHTAVKRMCLAGVSEYLKFDVLLSQPLK